MSRHAQEAQMELPRLIEIENGEKARGTFSDEEMSWRLAGLPLWSWFTRSSHS